MRISDALDRSWTIYANHPLFIHPNQVITYRHALSLLKHHDAFLQELIQNFRKDAVIAYLAGNSVDLILSVFICFGTNGALPALLNTRWTASEIASSLRSKPDTTIVLFGDGFEETASRAVSMLGSTAYALPLPSFRNSTHAEHAIPAEHPTTAAEHHSSIQDDAIVLFTSGTTSGAKGVLLSHLSLLIQSMAKMLPPCSYSSQTKMVANTVPFFHVGGLSSVLAVVLAGGSIVFPGEGGGFRPSSVLASLAPSAPPTQPHMSYFANTLVLVPAMLHSLLQELSETETFVTFPHVELILIGGQSCSDAQLHLALKYFPNARFVQTYACTEAGSSLTFAQLHPTKKKKSVSAGDFVGFPPPHVQIAVLSPEHQRLPPHTVGIIATKGPHLMNGYRNAPPTTGWFSTNDLGYLDENGGLYFCSRRTDVIRTGGETVFAPEVERVLETLPFVDECGVFGLRDERLGEVVSVAFVMKSSPEEPMEHSFRHSSGIVQNIESRIRDLFREQGLAGYKRPRKVFFVEELPRNSSGKVLKHKLREMFGRERSKL